jgi:hypothetical protein
MRRKLKQIIVALILYFHTSICIFHEPADAAAETVARRDGLGAGGALVLVVAHQVLHQQQARQQNHHGHEDDGRQVRRHPVGARHLHVVGADYPHARRQQRPALVLRWRR